MKFKMSHFLDLFYYTYSVIVLKHIVLAFRFCRFCSLVDTGVLQVSFTLESEENNSIPRNTMAHFIMQSWEEDTALSLHLACSIWSLSLSITLVYPQSRRCESPQMSVIHLVLPIEKISCPSVILGPFGWECVDLEVLPVPPGSVSSITCRTKPILKEHESEHFLWFFTLPGMRMYAYSLQRRNLQSLFSYTINVM